MSDYIPPELIPNILVRLPVNTLLLCTSVCKSWYLLITSPSFISSHLKFSNPNQESRLLIKYRTQSENNLKTHCCVHRDNQTFDKIVELDLPVAVENDVLRNIVGSFNGLFCLCDFRMERIMLWNPSLRKLLMLPEPRVLCEPYWCRPGSIGFGFLPATNDYKIVRVLYRQLRDANGHHNRGNKVPPEVEIYELSVGSWRTVNADDFLYDTLYYSPQAFLNGIVHWPAYSPPTNGNTFETLIASFDMKNEKFGALMLPICLQDDHRFTVHTFKESLCLIHNTNDFCSMWIMKEYGIADSWEKQFNIDIGVHVTLRPLYFRENEDILFEKRFKNSVDDTHSLVSYDPKKKEMNNVGASKNSHSFVVDSYVESLVLIKGLNEVMGRLGHHKENKKARIEIVTELDDQSGEGSKSEERQI